MEDAKIIELYWARDESAIKETDAAYGSRLRRLSRRIVSSDEDAEECVDDTYLRTWETIPPTRPQYLFAYLSQICRRIAFGLLDREGAQKRSATVVELTAELESCIPDKRQEQTVPEETLARLLEEFLWTQPEQSRRLFLRRYWYGESVAELAEASGLSKNAVKLRLLRTREKLREELEREGIL